VCSECDLLFMDPLKHPSQDEQKERYKKHKNSVQDAGYKDFLMQVASPCFEFIDKDSECLDYGCGPTKVMEELFKKNGYMMTSYDPFFYPQIPNKKYDLVTCNEVIEHFTFPDKELKKLCDLLKVGAYLAIGTQTWDERIDLKNWHYLTDPTHISIYKRHTLEVIARLFGLVTVGQNDDRVILFRKTSEINR